MKFRTPYNLEQFDDVTGHYEKNTLPSETVPDETMSIREIYQRYASGQPLGSVSMREPYYEGLNPSLPLDWNKMDIHERHEFAQKHQIKLTEAKQLLQDEKKKRDEETYKELIIAEYIAAEKEKNEKPLPNEKENKNP